MKLNLILGFVILSVACSIPALAEKEKRPDVSGFPFFIGAKGAPVRVPGLNAILLLTDEQKQKIHMAQQETVNSEAVAGAARTVKTDPNATEAQKQAARQAVQAAQEDLRKRVTAILTSEQKTLIERIHVIHEQVASDVSAEFQARFAASKGNEEEAKRVRKEAEEKRLAEFTRKVGEILTAEQREAMTKAAAEEKQRADEAAVKPKNK
jgi:hypothetical protein